MKVAQQERKTCARLRFMASPKECREGPRSPAGPRVHHAAGSLRAGGGSVPSRLAVEALWSRGKRPRVRAEPPPRVRPALDGRSDGPSRGALFPGAGARRAPAYGAGRGWVGRALASDARATEPGGSGALPRFPNMWLLSGHVDGEVAMASNAAQAGKPLLAAAGLSGRPLLASRERAKASPEWYSCLRRAGGRGGGTHRGEAPVAAPGRMPRGGGAEDVPRPARLALTGVPGGASSSEGGTQAEAERRLAGARPGVAAAGPEGPPPGATCSVRGITPLGRPPPIRCR